MRKFRTRKTNSNIQARMVPLIDVVFLLLIFFIMTINFRPQEGFMAAELPGTAISDEVSEVDPLIFYVDTLEDGDCRVFFSGNTITIDKENPDFSSFASLTNSVMRDRKRNVSDPVMLVDLKTTSWQHMMNMYDTLVSMGYKNIIMSGN